MAERNVMPEYRATESPVGKPAPPAVPRVLLRGQWLSEAGFGADTLLDVEVSEGRIVLTAVVS